NCPRAAPARGSCPGRHWPPPRRMRADSTLPSAACAPRPKCSTAFSCAASAARYVIDDAAARRPFLDAGEMVVLAVMPRPHRMNERAIRRLVVVEAARQAGEPLQCAVGVIVRRAVLEVDRSVAARRFAALERHIDDLGDRRVCRNLLEAAVAQNGGFERELRRESGAHLRLGARRTGLVVENNVAAGAVALDAVGDAAQIEDAVVERNVDLAANLRFDRGDAGAALALPAREPVRDALEPRPPECARFRIIFERGEMFFAER